MAGVRRARAAAVVLSLGLLAAACSGGGGDKQASSTTTSTSTSTTAAPTVAPLTGLPTTDAAVLRRPALVIKIDNADGRGGEARPQLGINQADDVVEEMVEGSVTRLAAIFQSQVPPLVGPVRSARATDVAVAEPLGRPLYAWSGGNKPTVAIIHSSTLRDVGYDAHPSAYLRRNQTGHVAPHNLYTHPDQLFALAPGDAGPPPALFQYRPAGQPAPTTASAVRTTHITFGNGPGSAPVDWTWDAGRSAFVRAQRGSAHLDEAGAQIAAANVVVAFVSYSNTGLVDVAGNAVPQADFKGSGTCWVLTDGRVIEGRWTKASDTAVATYTDAAGNPIKLTPGQTWLEVAPPGSASKS
jgi:hypothetical protein